MEHPIQDFTKGRFSHMIHDIKSLYFPYQDQIRISSLVYEELRIILINYLDDIFKQLVPLKNFQKNNLVTEQDILQILHFVPGMTPRLKHCVSHTVDIVSAKIKSQYTKLGTERSKLEKTRNILEIKYSLNQDNKKVEQELNNLDTEIRSLQEQQYEISENYFYPSRNKRMELQENLKGQNSCFYFYPKAVRRLIDYLLPEYNLTFTFTDDAYLLLQFDLEYFLKQLLKNSVRAVYHSKRETIMPKDIQLSKAAMAEYEKIILKPRFVYPENNVSYRTEYIKIREDMRLEEKIVDENLILQLDRFNHLLIDLLIQYAHVYSLMEKSSTITKHSLQTAVKSIFPGKLAKHALLEGKRSEQNNSKLSFHIKTDFKINPDANIFLSTVIEYMSAEIISLMNGLNSISLFYSALEDDQELFYLKNHLEFVPIKMT
jgi:histone H3/H4